MTSLASGFAVASNPVLAQAIITDSLGLVSGEISVAVADGKIAAYRAMPTGPGKFPVLLKAQELFAVHEPIEDMCRRFAKMGDCAIAPEMDGRQGNVSMTTDIGALLPTVVAKVPDSQASSDLDAAVAFAGASGNGNGNGNGNGDTARVGLVGYCWGGRAGWVYAHCNTKLKAAMSYHGLLDGGKPFKPQDAVDFAANLKVPVLGLYAGIDGFVKPAVIDSMRAGIVKSGSGSEIVVFQGVNHGFKADCRPTYDKTAAPATKETCNRLVERRRRLSRPPGPCALNPPKGDLNEDGPSIAALAAVYPGQRQCHVVPAGAVPG